MMKSIFMLVASIAVLWCFGCSSYRHKQWMEPGPLAGDNPEKYSLRFIESDDEGWLWDRRQADDSIQLIRDKVAEKNTIVVVFVHGWHHSARLRDGNIEGFRHTLSKLKDEVKPSGDFNIVGLYVGWRGRSLPWFLDYVTFWGRKGAAERVGQNDVKEFLMRLQDVYSEFRKDVPSRGLTNVGKKQGNFLGLVTIGHSFGGQVLLKALNGSIEDQLQLLNRTPTYLRDRQQPEQRIDIQRNLYGIGDLVILINPAAEASQYHRLHLLSRGLNYSPLQSPILLTVSAENDNARHRFFTVGRVLGEVFTRKPRKQDAVERTVERQALGVYPGHVTHWIGPVDKDARLIRKPLQGDGSYCNDEHPCNIDWYEWKKDPIVRKPDSLDGAAAALEKLPRFDFSGPVVFSGVELKPLNDVTFGEICKDTGRCEDHRRYASCRVEKPPGQGADKVTCSQPYQPLIVATANKHLINNHSGIFTKPFLQFLVPYIAFIESKSSLNLGENQQRLEKSMTSE